MLGCFSRLKRPPSSDSAPLPAPMSDSAPSTSTSSNSSTSMLFTNFNSLYDGHPHPSDVDSDRSPTTTTTTTATATATASYDNDDVDLCSAIASRRFFFPACPGRSKSIVDSAAAAVSDVYGIGSGVAVPTYSPDPYSDFRRSMEEMVQALGLDESGHWARLHELLLCYLALNSKQTHKYIISAFADLLLGLDLTTKE